jgi:tetratricopeptide (TPR) repeat protein
VLARLPGNFHALHMLGVAALHDGRPDDSLRHLDAALRIEPDEAGAHYNRGLTLRALKRPEEALASYERAVTLRPEFADAWNNRGLTLRDLGRPAEAAASYRRALALRPEGVDALNNLGNVLRDLERFDEAYACFDRALALRPGYATGHNNRGTVLQAQCRFEAALPQHLHAQVLDPMNVEAHWNEGLCRLTLGDLRTGFEKFEWRWEKPEFEGMRKVFPQPPWLGGEDIAGRTVLLWAEQGLGDVLQFCRYAPLVSARGARVVLGLQPELKRLLARLPGVAQVAGSGEALPRYDYHCPLMSLPLVFGTTLENIPAAVPYLSADEAKVAEWRARLGPARGRRIGLAWSGNPEHKNDRNRSIALEMLAPVLKLDAEFISVQKEVRPSDQAALDTYGIRHYGEALRDFEDTAALLMSMDLVIAVDTAVAHLAGALGRPVWILLPYAPDWRWLLGREDSPWYPTARLFRQAALGDWDHPVQRIVAELGR